LFACDYTDGTVPQEYGRVTTANWKGTRGNIGGDNRAAVWGFALYSTTVY